MAGKLQGLSSKEAKRRLEKYGQNVLPEKPPPSNLSILLSQVKSPLVYVLLAAGIVTLALREFSDTTIILFVVVLNTVLGFFQERRASQALSALKALIHPKVRVIRDGVEKDIEVSQIVKGDIALLKYGYKVPADGELIEVKRLCISEALLTGESIPINKDEGDRAYMGTVVVGGVGKLRVEKTGLETEMGKIAEKVQESVEKTPFEKQLERFSKQLSGLVLILTVFVFLAGLVSGRPVIEIFKTSVALAVSAIPEGLLVALTVVLAIGMQRILAKKGLVRNLVSAETLGGVTTICADKTGTLTKGKLRVAEVLGDKEEIARQALFTSDDPIMEPTLAWVKKEFKDLERSSQKLLKKCKRLDYLPFSPQNRFFASLNKDCPSQSSVKGGQAGQVHNMIFVNGASEVLLACSDIDEGERSKLLKKIDEFTRDGKRIIGIARKKTSSSTKKLSIREVSNNLTWIGMLVFSDPVRHGVSKVLGKVQKAGIKFLLITGDYAQTAMSVMRELGMEIDEKEVVLGSELEKISTDELARKLSGTYTPKLFARTKPEQKLKIVEALKKNGEVVAMMGDGINDAPALAKADIGIVVGEATEVAKESADLVLLDSRFETVVEAIREGRGIFDNIRKIILYLMSDAFEEIIAVVGTIVLGLPLPVTAAQILWINIISDGFPHLALTVDPKTEGILNQPPRKVDEELVASWMRKLILIVSCVGGILALSLFMFFYKESNDLSLARSVAFATLGINSLLYVFSIRTLKEPFWRENSFKNKWLNFAVLAGLSFQLLPFATYTTREFFGLSQLKPIQWLSVFTASVIVFITIESLKVILKKD